MDRMEKTSFDQLLMDVFREMGAHRPEQIFPGRSLSLSEIYALNILAERSPLSQQELGDALALEKSSVSRLVQQLERRGWVTRERDARDSRLRLLRLTDQGARIAEELQQFMYEHHAALFNQLSPEEQAALILGLSALRRALRDKARRPNALHDDRSGQDH
jgi:MarR family transcriptional regulator, lower aerobic nicotinate degradation pathway regulator